MFRGESSRHGIGTELEFGAFAALKLERWKISFTLWWAEVDSYRLPGF